MQKTLCLLALCSLLLPSLQGQNYDNWTIWSQGSLMVIDSACTVSLECDDNDPTTIDYCNGQWCIHTSATFNPLNNPEDIDVDAQGNVWVTSQNVQNAGTLGPALSRFDGVRWQTYDRRNSAIGAPNPDPYPFPGFNFVNSAIAPDGSIYSLSNPRVCIALTARTGHGTTSVLQA
jgi:hypothetical protein